MRTPTMNSFSSTSLSAGSAKVDITPAAGIQLAGDIGRYRPAEWVSDPLYARALVLRNRDQTLCIISLDLTGLTRPWADAIRNEVARAAGCSAEDVMVHALQSHSAPCLGHAMIRADNPYIPTELSWIRGGDDRYHEFAVKRAVQAASLALSRLAPARVGYAGATEGRVAFNRRFVMRDGKVKTHPGNADPTIRHVEGPVDPELGAILFQGEDLSTQGMMVNYTCHPTHGYPHRWVSADWPGVLAGEMDRSFQMTGAALVTNGWCGNIHHTNHLDPDWKDDYHRMGKLLAATTQAALQRSIQYIDRPILDARMLELRLPKRLLPAAEQDAARALLADHPEPVWIDEARTAIRWDWVYAVSRLDYLDECQRQPEYDFPIQVFRIGEIALVGVPGEPFVEGQLRLKLESPTYPTYALHMCNDEAGYIPTPQAFRGGGYETETAHWSFLGPEALDCIVDGALGMLKDMFRG